MSGEAEEHRIAEYKRQIEAYEAEQQQKAKVFDPKAIAENARQIQTLVDSELGVIRYGMLTWKEFKALNLQEIEDDEEKAYRVLHAMLRKAEPDLTWEDFEALPFHVKALLTERLSTVFPRFLPQQQPTGSRPTVKPNS